MTKINLACTRCLIASAAMSIVLSSCGKKKNGDSGEADKQTEIIKKGLAKDSIDSTLDIEGVWKMSCNSYDSDNDGTDDSASTDKLSFENGSYVDTIHLYDGTSCGSGGQVFYLEGTYGVGEIADDEDDSYFFDWEASLVTLTLKDSGSVTSFNSAEFCGYSDWTLDTAKNITSDSCNGMYFSHLIYDLVKIEDEVLYLGDFTDELDASSEAKRPTSIDKSEKYKLTR